MESEAEHQRREALGVGPQREEKMDLDPIRCYRAVLARDRRFDGQFFVGVRTTGIFCRPICPSPTPREKNVEYFRHAAAAIEAGYRPCRRCHPESAPGSPAWQGAPAVVQRGLRLIGDGALNDNDVDALAATLGVTARHLRRLFDAHVGASPAAVARVTRLNFARRLLDSTDLRVSEIAFAAGFRSLRQFNDAFRATFAASPRVLRARHDRSASAGLVLHLSYRPPFAWSSLLHFLAARATPGVEIVADGGYQRTIGVGDTAGIISVRHDSKAGRVTLALDVPTLDGVRQIVTRARHLFDLDADPLAIARHLGRSSVLASLLRRRPGLRVPGAWDGFEMAVRAVLGQQIAVQGATTLAGRLADQFGEPLASPRPGLTRLFPTPRALSQGGIEAIGLPRVRANTIQSLAAAVRDGRLSFDGAMDARSLVQSLQSIHGIGPWTAEYVALRACAEPDAFPAEDLGIRRVLGTPQRPLSVGQVRAASEAWRPWRGYAAVHLWTAGSHTSAAT